METKKIVEKLNNFCESFFSKNVVEMDISLFKEAAERLEELESELGRRTINDRPYEWISVENGKEMPDAFSYTGIRHDQFPRLVVAIDENSHVTHWMMLDAPKPKEPTFKDVFLKAFPKATMYNDGIPLSCRASIFGGKCSLGSTKCFECWNQSYFEEEEKE